MPQVRSRLTNQCEQLRRENSGKPQSLTLNVEAVGKGVPIISGIKTKLYAGKNQLILIS